MPATQKVFAALTAGDLMTGDLLLIPEDMPTKEAAHLLLKNHVSGAPVVDRQGRCVGMLSAGDFVRLAAERECANGPGHEPLPKTCSFQTKFRTSDGRVVTLCTQPAGVCPIQLKQTDARAGELLVCSQPHSVMADWQTVEVEQLPVDRVSKVMTKGLVTVEPERPIPEVARLMIVGHIHRVIIVDAERQPLGLVSSSDILAAVARAGGAS
jgi:CBS domain-containing protein